MDKEQRTLDQQVKPDIALQCGCRITPENRWFVCEEHREAVEAAVGHKVCNHEEPTNDKAPARAAGP